MSIRRALRLSYHILNAYALQHSTHGTTSLKTGTSSSRLEEHLSTTE